MMISSLSSRTLPLHLRRGFLTRAVAKVSDEYDYVVCGAGSAGGVIATRLAEDKSNTIAVIEAGVSLFIYSFISSDFY
jgi:ribulose 1,5-bisphosphate synthetase/thiazole synthase